DTGFQRHCNSGPFIKARVRPWLERSVKGLSLRRLLKSLCQVGTQVLGGLQADMQAHQTVLTLFPIAVAPQEARIYQLHQTFKATPGKADTKQRQGIHKYPSLRIVQS